MDGIVSIYQFKAFKKYLYLRNHNQYLNYNESLESFLKICSRFDVMCMFYKTNYFVLSKERGVCRYVVEETSSEGRYESVEAALWLVYSCTVISAQDRGRIWEKHLWIPMSCVHQTGVHLIWTHSHETNIRKSQPMNPSNTKAVYKESSQKIFSVKYQFFLCLIVWRYQKVLRRWNSRVH